MSIVGTMKICMLMGPIARLKGACATCMRSSTRDFAQKRSSAQKVGGLAQKLSGSYLRMMSDGCKGFEYNGGSFLHEENADA